MRVALVHDWLTTMRGGERVLHALAGLFPDADLYTLVHRPGSVSARIEGRRIRTSVIDRLPGGRRHFRKLLPLLPWVMGRFRLDGYDLVLSSSHAVAKAVRWEAPARHVCYCHTPMRYVWDEADAYLGRGLRRAVASPLVAGLRRWDAATSGPSQIHRVLANSRFVADRVRRHWRRDAAVVPPPVDLERFQPSGRPDAGYYLLVGAFVAYKREDVAVEAFARTGRRLLVVGDGPRRRRIASRAPANVEFLGWVDDERLARLYADCRAVVHPHVEDAGIVPLEAQAAGRPVVALGRGGATETVLPLGGAETPTGVWFDRQDAAALAAAVARLEENLDAFDPAAIRRHAERFGIPRFAAEVRRHVDEVMGAARADRREPVGV